jgi:hypothetical protein
MTDFKAVTDDVLARARANDAVRARIVADHLDALLAQLSRLRTSPKAAKDPVIATQIRDGVAMAVRLAEILQATETPPRRDGTRPENA